MSLEAVFRRGQILSLLLQSEHLRSEAFARFWISFTGMYHAGSIYWAYIHIHANTANKNDLNLTTPPVPQDGAPNTDAQDNAAGPSTPQKSGDLIPPLLARASGTVLDIGPGSGTQMPYLRSPAIRAIYGAEPCVDLHGELRASAQREGLNDKYRIVPSSVVAAELLPALQKDGVVSAETNSVDDLRAHGGVFDTIVCVRVLCSVPEMEKTVAELYALLRPGGKMLVTEHVVNPWRTAKGSFVARFMQSLYQALGWSWFLGDCCLTRDTGEMLKRAADMDGGWEVADLERSFGRSPLSYVSGVLVKRGA